MDVAVGRGEDALELLGNDPDARFHPYRPGFKYRKIGRDSVPEPGYPKFVASDPDPSVELDTFVPHESRLNLSVLVRVPGHITLDEDAKKFGFEKEFPTFIFRNYTMIESGNANCPQVPFAMSKATFDAFASHGMVTGTWEKGEPALVDFTVIPVMNRARADGATSAKAVCELKGKELELKGEQKVLKYYLDEATAGEGVKEKGPLTKDQVEYLAKFGVGFNGFAPPVKKADPTDEYEAKEFSIDVKGFSNLPPVKEVLQRMDFLVVGKDDKGKAAKPLTVSQELLANTVRKVQAEVTKRKGKLDATYTRWLNTQIQDNKVGFKSLRAEMQRIKMAVILAGRWFDEFSSRENCQLEHNGLTFKFSLDTVKIKI